MDLTNLLNALVLGLIEGLTEFLPISSTGHLILAGALMGFESEKAKLFEVVIQSGAILAVCWEYRRKIAQVVIHLPSDPAARRFALNLGIGFVPIGVLGLLFGKAIKTHLFNATVVATAFIVGGLIILWAERRTHRARIHTVDEIGWTDALKLGLAQCLALIPGTSRAGATIVGGLFFGLSRQAATEFSFFLAIPTLLVATGYDLYKTHRLLEASDTGWFAAGFVAAFLSAFLAVRALLLYIQRHDFTAFAAYRILFGLTVLATDFSGLVRWSG